MISGYMMREVWNISCYTSRGQRELIAGMRVQGCWDEGARLLGTSHMIIRADGDTGAWGEKSVIQNSVCQHERNHQGQFCFQSATRGSHHKPEADYEPKPRP